MCMISILKQYFFTNTAMTPGPVQNLKLTLDRNKPSLTLDWEQPTNIDLGNPAELTQYDIWFKPQSPEGYNWNCQSVPSSSTTLTLTRKSGLVLGQESQFAVRAQNCDRQAGEWVSVTQMIGMPYIIHYLVYIPSAAVYIPVYNYAVIIDETSSHPKDCMQ